MTYEAHRWDSIENRWYVTVGDSRVFGLGEGAETLLEAEAKIIVFALSAVAEGRNLYSRPRVWHGGVPYGEAQYTRYTGPTEGVAP